MPSETSKKTARKSNVKKRVTSARRKVKTAARSTKRKRPVARTLDKALAAAEAADRGLRNRTAAGSIGPEIAAIVGMESMPLEQLLDQQWA